MNVKIFERANNECLFLTAVGTTTTHLTVVRVNSDPAPVKDHQVPVFLYSRQSFVADQWDLTTNQVRVIFALGFFVLLFIGPISLSF